MWGQDKQDGKRAVEGDNEEGAEPVSRASEETADIIAALSAKESNSRASSPTAVPSGSTASSMAKSILTACC